MASKNNNTAVVFPKGIGKRVFSKDVTGVLVNILPPAKQYYQIEVDGIELTIPASYTAVFADGTRFNWSAYETEDENGNTITLPWDQFDPSIDLIKCLKDKIEIHLWKDENGRQHLELA